MPVEVLSRPVAVYLSDPSVEALAPVSSEALADTMLFSVLPSLLNVAILHRCLDIHAQMVGRNKHVVSSKCQTPLESILCVPINSQVVPRAFNRSICLNTRCIWG